MRKSCIKVELKKALWNKAFLASFVIFSVIALMQVGFQFTQYRLFEGYLAAGKISGNPMIPSISLFCNWIGADTVSYYGNLFYFLFPLLVVFPYGWSLAGELHTGYTSLVLSRISKKEYFFSKYIASFVSGAVSMGLPLVLNVLALALFLPCLKPENIYPYGSVTQKCVWSEFFYEQPFLYLVLYLLLDLVFAGLIATVPMVLAFFTKSKVAVMGIPFLLLLLLDYIDSSIISDNEFSILRFVRALPVADSHHGLTMFSIGLALFAVTVGVLWYKVRKS